MWWSSPLQCWVCPQINSVQDAVKAVVVVRCAKDQQMSDSSTLEMAVRCAIEEAQRVYASPEWHSWADAWLSGTDRTAKGAEAAERIADADARLPDVTEAESISTFAATLARTASELAKSLAQADELRRAGYDWLADILVEATETMASVIRKVSPLGEGNSH